MKITTPLAWLAAFFSVGGFYIGAFDAEELHLSTIFGAAVLTCLAAMAILRAPFVTLERPRGLRASSSVALIVALVGFTASTVNGAFAQGLVLQDLGLFALLVAVPVMLLFADRSRLIQSMCYVAIAFALADAAANFLAAANLITLQTYSGRIDEAGVRLRYPGLSGSTHAAGLVCFVALTYLFGAFDNHRRLVVRGLVAAAIVALAASLYLIDARRYLVLALAAAVLILFRPARRTPLPLLAAGIAFVMLWLTFHADYADIGNQLRARLMVRGLGLALEHPIIGEGLLWRDNWGLISTYSSLAGAGVTESQLLDFAIAYGVPTAVIFLLSALLAIAARRENLTIPAILVTLMTSELAFGGALTGFMGSVLFYASLIYCQRDEVQVAAPRSAPMSPGAGSPPPRPWAEGQDPKAVTGSLANGQG